MSENYNSEYIGRMGQSSIYKIEKEKKELYFAIRILSDPLLFAGEVTIDFENNKIKKGNFEMKFQYLDDNKIEIIKNGPVDKDKYGAVFPSEMPFKLPIIDGYYFTREAVDEVKLAAGDSNNRLAKLLGKDNAVQQFLFKSKTKKSKTKTKKSKSKKSKSKKSKSKKSKSKNL